MSKGVFLTSLCSSNRFRAATLPIATHETGVGRWSFRRASLSGYLPILALGLLACGYRPLRSGLQGNPKVRVARAVGHVAAMDEAAVVELVANGARAEFARFGALSAQSGVDVEVLTIEIVRIEERGEGAAVFEAMRPLARGVRIQLTARGVLQGQSASFETNDYEASEVVATGGFDTLAWSAARTAAARGAARKVGALIARAVLGLP
ncbi:MAG: hypothetical protein NVSMB1_24610 [Polyangiales bacterium]